MANPPISLHGAALHICMAWVGAPDLEAIEENKNIFHSIA
jgi:hypothetical protein